jgi:hypothetical protein
LLDAAHELAEAPVVAAAIVQTSFDARSEDEVLVAMTPGQGTTWLRACGWHDFAPTPPTRGARTGHLDRREAIARWQSRWQPTDDRLVWVATMLAVHENPSRAADPRLPAKMTCALHDAFVQRRDQAPAIDRAPANGPSPEPSPVARRQDMQSPGMPPLETSAFSSGEGEAAATPPCGQSTACAGLLFLVPILERLGFGGFLGANPVLLDKAFPARLLLYIGDRVGMALDDPQVLALLPAADGDEPDEPAAFDLRELPGAARDLLSTSRVRAALDEPLAAWLTLVRRWCRRYARQGLVSLIRRRGRVQISRTHIDVYFDLTQIDLRLRRLALDVDPEWVPWLGRVVRFHYLDCEDREVTP